jgi:sulfate permease, SulP family
LSFSFRPNLLRHLPGYNAGIFQQDLAAGVAVAVVALPLAMAFAIASGVKPEQGIIAAVVGGLLISLLGGSRVQIGGPAGAFVGLLYGIVQQYGAANLLIATTLAGVLLFALGALRLGGLVRYVPRAVVAGFTSGIAVIIALSQVRDFFGLKIEQMPANFFSQLAVIHEALPSINIAAVSIGFCGLVFLFLWTRIAPKLSLKLPGALLVLIGGTLAAWALQLPVETIGSRFGALSAGFPVPSLPAFDWSTVQRLVAPTIAIAMLGAIESLLCARMADTMTKERHDPNQELMAQGVANMVVPLFGGIAATGTIARTVTNIKSGARTPVAGIVHAIVLLILFTVAAPLAIHVPLAALAAILLHVAIRMMEWSEFKRLPRFSWSYRIVFLLSFLLTVVFDITVAVEVGLLSACLFFIHRVATVTRIEAVSLSHLSTHDPKRAAVAGTVQAYRLFGSFFFGTANKLEEAIALEPPTRWLILDMHQVINLDTSALDVLQGIHQKLVLRHGGLIFMGLTTQPASLISRSGFAQRNPPTPDFDTNAQAFEWVLQSP